MLIFLRRLCGYGAGLLFDVLHDVKLGGDRRNGN
jgi:hypothetical protein